MQADFPQIDIHRTGQNIKMIMQLQKLTVKDIQEYLGLSTPQSIYYWLEEAPYPLAKIRRSFIVCFTERSQESYTDIFIGTV